MIRVKKVAPASDTTGRGILRTMKELMKRNMVIWKFELDFKQITEVNAPEVILPLSAQLQGQSVCVWAIVDPLSPIKRKKFQVIPTGQRFNPTGKHYIGTVQAGAFVWHIFSLSNY